MESERSLIAALQMVSPSKVSFLFKTRLGPVALAQLVLLFFLIVKTFLTLQTHSLLDTHVK